MKPPIDTAMVCGLSLFHVVACVRHWGLPQILLLEGIVVLLPQVSRDLCVCPLDPDVEPDTSEKQCQDSLCLPCNIHGDLPALHDRVRCQ